MVTMDGICYKSSDTEGLLHEFVTHASLVSFKSKLNEYLALIHEKFISRTTLALYCRSSEWRNGNNGNCFNETYPIQRPFWGSGSNLSIIRAVGKTLREMKVNVTFLNITQLSELRKDGHTSVYTERRGKLVTSEQRLKPLSFADCIHWCLPGVPDTWNEILFAYLIGN